MSKKRGNIGSHGAEKGAHKEGSANGPAKKEAADSEINKNMPGRYYPYISGAIIVILAALVIYLLVRNPNPGTDGDGAFAGDKVKVEFYVMSQCPYGTQVEDAIFPVLEKMGDGIDFKLEYIASETTPGVFQSLHGEKEVKGNIAQLCVKSYYEADYKYMDFIMCQNKDAANVDTNWVTCAQENSMDVDKLRSCIESDEGKDLLRTSIARSQARGAKGSPTMYVADSPYNSARDSLSFQRAICKYSKHPACAEIPAPVKVNAIVLNDKRCVECVQGMAQLTSQLKALFSGLEVKELDYSSAEGKQLFESSQLKYLPAILFDETVKQGEAYDKLESYLEPAGSYTNLMIGASFDPKAEICDNTIDDDNNGKIDCADDYCTNNFVCRPEIKQKIDLFIMSDCPYGRKAVLALKEASANFKEKMSFEIHYIASLNADGSFQSLHGAYEAEEDMRQLCTLKHAKAKWFDYVSCSSGEVPVKGADWNTCADKVGMTAAEKKSVSDCTSGAEGKALLAEDIKIADSLGVSASPTWFTNNKYEFSGIDAETVKTNFCKYNTGVTGCENTLSQDTTTTGSC